MEQLLVLAALLLLGPALYALGRVHGRGDVTQAEVQGFQTGHQAGWTSCFRATLAYQRTSRVSHNAAGTLYQAKRVLSDPDDTVRMQRVV